MKWEDVPTESSAFELLAAVQTVTEFQEPDIVLCDRIYQMPCGPKLTQGKFVVILVVQDINERRQERVKVLVPTSTIDIRNLFRKLVNAHRA